MLLVAMGRYCERGDIPSVVTPRELCRLQRVLHERGDSLGELGRCRTSSDPL